MRRTVRGRLRGGITLKYLNASGRWPSGRVRYYYRPPGRKGVPLPDAEPDDPAFLAAYSAAAAGGDPPRSVRTGSIGAAVRAFLASDAYLGRARSTRAVWRRLLDDISIRYGTARLADLEARHIKADLARLPPHPSNNRRKVWRALCAWCAEAGLLVTNPATGVPARRTPKSEGHVPWTAAEIARFRDRWPIGTAQRLAFEAIFWTGARMSDATRLGDGMVDGQGWLCYRQVKTGGDVAVPLFRSLPAVAAGMEADQAMLHAALAARQHRHLVWMVTDYGKPRSRKGASSWFSAAARAAGITGRSAHGLRKSRSIALAESGATAHQLGAWLGHESLKEIEHYARRADRRRILSGPEQEQNSSNSPKQSSKSAKK
ncbi:hypothetical protein DDZ14_08325 [Maritimibacter sp. 55A14]|uniref:tyrosine-type recombinase/integrase n=1 Tax=Maritimibacter sp. 55A14 TaxID=2174844 RepID=UPI000D60CE89|nr:tyrosine-type recombinase/integrase [Maritimibacter sp. 55A14]PWE32743.1 hypothetical protein DDZ14_08325 [Maritimibacter sp. 55A14]